MSTLGDYDPTQVRVTFNGLTLPPASDAPISAGTTPKALTITLKPSASEGKALAELLRAEPGLPLPLVLSSRERPKRRRHARGGLRRMVRARRSLVLHGVRASGGVDQPWTITAECVTSKRYDDAKKALTEHIREVRARPGSEIPVDAPVLIDEYDSVVYRRDRRANNEFLRETLGLRPVWRDGVLTYEPHG